MAPLSAAEHELAVRLIHPRARPPRRAHPGDGGLDLYAVAEAVIAPGGGRAEVPTGIALAIPFGHAGVVVPRSGLARRSGVTLSNAPGLIDSGYRGEVVVLMVNHGPEAHTVAVGDRVAQLMVVPITLCTVVAVDELPPSDGRGTGGFGSTGA